MSSDKTLVSRLMMIRNANANDILNTGSRRQCFEAAAVSLIPSSR